MKVVSHRTVKKVAVKVDVGGKIKKVKVPKGMKKKVAMKVAMRSMKKK